MAALIVPEFVISRSVVVSAIIPLSPLVVVIVEPDSTITAAPETLVFIATALASSSTCALSDTVNVTSSVSMFC